MTHNTPESSQTNHNGLTKLGIASDSGSANKALQPGTPILLQGCMCQEGDGTFYIPNSVHYYAISKSLCFYYVDYPQTFYPFLHVQ